MLKHVPSPTKRPKRLTSSCACRSAHRHSTTIWSARAASAGSKWCIGGTHRVSRTSSASIVCTSWKKKGFKWARQRGANT